MHVGSSGDRGEEEMRKTECERVAHGINKNVRYKKPESIVGEDQRAEGLSQQREPWVGTAEHVLASGEVEEYDSWRMKTNIESSLQAA